MRLNPLWMLFLMMLLFGSGVLILPLVLICAVFLGFFVLAGFSSGGWADLPRRLWDLTNAKTRANYALCHAVLALVRSRSGLMLQGWAEPNGFFIEGTNDETSLYELTEQALARLRNGERELIAFSSSRTFKVLAWVVIFLVLAFLGPAGWILAAAAAYFGWPWVSLMLQNWILRADSVRDLTVQSASYQRRTVSYFGGRVQSLREGVSVMTSPSGAIEAEIVD